MKIIETIGVIFYALTIGSLFGLCIYIFVYLTIFVEMPEYEIVFRIIGFMMFNSVIAYVCGLILNGYEKTKNNNKKIWKESKKMQVTLCDICKEKIIREDSYSHILVKNVIINKQYNDFEDICDSCEKELIKLILQIKNRPKEAEWKQH